MDCGLAVLFRVVSGGLNLEQIQAHRTDAEAQKTRVTGQRNYWRVKAAGSLMISKFRATT